MGPAKEERTMEYVLTTEALTKRYKHFSALNGLSLHVPKGAIYGLVGQNGLRYKLKNLSSIKSTKLILYGKPLISRAWSLSPIPLLR